MGVPGVTGTAPTVARRRELGRCLRSYRERVTPQRVGLPEGARRRTPGLRREEVAALAGVGLTWYTWLEQGRVSASDQVLRAVGRVLGIDEVGVAHLCRLAREDDPVPGPAAGALRPLLASWPDQPAVLLDDLLGVVAANRAWEAAVGPPAQDTAGRRNVLWQLAADPAARHRIGRTDELLAALHRRFRMASDLDPGRPAAHRVRDALRHDAPERAALWDCRGIGAFGRPRVRLGDRDRTAFLLGEAGAPGAAVLVLVDG
ncbi:helix-turn-helix domain-containing protein [Pseudonocardia sp. NPDC046786]|uniref:helix-turn-helix domain-containing protein n=1 Tax=Pseudonocardia sp. NPDC046786 TaxID=3155471 RepID=UPI0033C2D0F0